MYAALAKRWQAHTVSLGMPTTVIVPGTHVLPHFKPLQELGIAEALGVGKVTDVIVCETIDDLARHKHECEEILLEVYSICGREGTP
jgi:hypothetical protein